MRRRWKMLLVVACMFSCLFTGCSIGNTEFALDLNNVGRNDVFSINGQECTKEEARLYLCNFQNIYGYEYGVDLWQHDFGDLAPEGALEDYVKDITLSELAAIMCMNQLAEEREIELTAEEKALAADAADEYYESLSKEEISYMSIDRGEVRDFYEKYALAQKLYKTLTEGVNEEVSDDEARVMRVQQIFVSSEEDALVVQTKLNNGSDFDTVASNYNEAASIEINLARGMLPEEVDDVAFKLDDGEQSDMIVTEGGYYFIKCINKYDEELSEANKENIIVKRREEQFDNVFREFIDNSDFELNEKVWEDIKVDTSGDIKTDSFFSTYDKYFEQ